MANCLIAKHSSCQNGNWNEFPNFSNAYELTSEHGVPGYFVKGENFGRGRNAIVRLNLLDLFIKYGRERKVPISAGSEPLVPLTGRELPPSDGGFEVLLSDVVLFHELVQLSGGDPCAFGRILDFSSVSEELFPDVVPLDDFKPFSPRFSKGQRGVHRHAG